MPRLIMLTLMLLAALSALVAQSGSHGSYLDEDYAPGYPDYGFPQPGIGQLLQVWEGRFVPQLPEDEQDAALDLLAELRARIWQLSQPSQPAHGHGAFPRPMHPRDFEQFEEDVKDAFFGDDALHLINLVAEDNYFSASQIVAVLDQLTWSDDKLDALRAMFPRCVDKRNKYKILACFTYSSDKDEAEKIIRARP